eukprot:COSAG05_NODE_3000_length_2422_cov_2.065863_1_plen_96_part_00
MGIPDASLRGWILEVDVGIPAGTFFLIVLALIIQIFSSAVVHVYFINNDVQPAAESAPLMDKLKTSSSSGSAPSTLFSSWSLAPSRWSPRVTRPL